MTFFSTKRFFTPTFSITSAADLTVSDYDWDLWSEFLFDWVFDSIEFVSDDDCSGEPTVVEEDDLLDFFRKIESEDEDEDEDENENEDEDEELDLPQLMWRFIQSSQKQSLHVSHDLCMCFVQWSSWQMRLSITRSLWVLDSLSAIDLRELFMLLNIYVLRRRIIR